MITRVCSFGKAMKRAQGKLASDRVAVSNTIIILYIVWVLGLYGEYKTFAPRYQPSASPRADISGLRSDCVLISTVIQPADQNTMKDKLFNDILQLLVSVKIHIRINEIPIMKKLIVLLRNDFWHIDGHHHVFEQQVMAIPAFFSSFTGYNCPERSKHRKRLTQNMSSDALHDCYDPIEKLYYSTKNDPICMYCTKDQPYTSEKYYPSCSDCESQGKVAVLKRK